MISFSLLWNFKHDVQYEVNNRKYNCIMKLNVIFLRHALITIECLKVVYGVHINCLHDLTSHLWSMHRIVKSFALNEHPIKRRLHQTLYEHWIKATFCSENCEGGGNALKDQEKERSRVVNHLKNPLIQTRWFDVLSKKDLLNRVKTKGLFCIVVSKILSIIEMNKCISNAHNGESSDALEGSLAHFLKLRNVFGGLSPPLVSICKVG